MPKTNKTKQPKTYVQFSHLQGELFWKTPKFLLKNDEYANLTNDDRMAYAVIRDRFGYSEANNWTDDKGVFIFFPLEQIEKELRVSEYKAIQIKQHLVDANLIDIEHAHFDSKIGKNIPDKFYLLTPKYNPKDLMHSAFPKKETSIFEENIDIQTKSTDVQNKQNTKSLDNTGVQNFESGNATVDLEKNADAMVNQADAPESKKPESLDNTGTQIFKANKDNNFITKDTIKDTNTDTQTEEWDFDSSNYSQEIVEEQNRDLLHNLANTLTTDPAIPMFLSKESINLITLWFKTPKGVSDCISVILNAANSSRRDATEQIGGHELYFEDCQGDLKRMISFKLRRFFNKMRTSKKGTIKSPRNYLFIAMKNMFDKWQNDILMAEHEANASA